MFEEQETQKVLAAVLSNTSVQLRAFMTSLHTSIREGRTEESLEHRAATFYQNYYRMLRTAINLEDASRIARPDCCPPLCNGDVVCFCRKLCEECEDLFQDNGLTLRFSSDCAGHVMSLAPYSLRRTLMNLLSNALKFTPPGGEVRVQVEARHAPIRITVSDNGRGMDEDTRAHAFTQCLRSDCIPSPNSGLGLGLLLCRTFVCQLGGSLVVDSAEGRGTRVSLSLPELQSGDVRFHDCMSLDYTGGFNRTLVELSDALDDRFFQRKYLD